MNDGYLALIAMWCLLIVIWSGWLDRFFRRHRFFPNSAMLLFTGLSLFSSWWILPFFAGHVRVIPFFLPIIVAAYLWIKEASAKHRVQLATASILIGVSIFLMQLLFRLDPILMFTNEKWLVAGFTILLLFVTAQRLSHQWILLALGLALSDLCLQLFNWQKTGSMLLGSAFFQDVWWISACGLAVTRYLLGFGKWPTVFRRKRAKSTSIARIEEIK
ncbi:hypothetical protein BEP19_01725 [Ammoniphilus oxalaticus]|uniref:Uncharacterized protein n=1 Tax=Ammoniphilus oxalaticus TaxID=66863 RepID=A0A419SN36_9BACL|nr:hypothetical protein [Ammoniphilus oxalaticus]RKD25687.1 hypothetical protein BEP19_01725 [Ammoniphilus oxalaticus]